MTTYSPVRPMGFKAQIASSAVLIAPLYLVMTGTAGIYSPQAFAQLADFSPTPIIRVVGRKSDTQVRGTAENLLRVRDIFGLKMSELAEIFSVSRTAAYDWLSGTVPKPEVSLKIEMLASYADSIAQTEGNRTTSLRRNPLLAGRTLVQTMKTGQNLEAVILKLREGSVTEQPKLTDGMVSTKRSMERTNSLSEIITPVILERS